MTPRDPPRPPWLHTLRVLLALGAHGVSEFTARATARLVGLPFLGPMAIDWGPWCVVQNPRTPNRLYVVLEGDQPPVVAHRRSHLVRGPYVTVVAEVSPGGSGEVVVLLTSQEARTEHERAHLLRERDEDGYRRDFSGV